MGGAGFGGLLLAAAALVLGFGAPDFAGFDGDDLVLFLGAAGVALVAANWMVNEYRASWAEGLRATAFWGIVLALGIAAYAYRTDLLTVVDRVIGEVSPGRSVTTSAGEVVVPRRADGSFTLSGKVNERDTRFMFDTGASTVVLTADAASALGLPVSTLSYNVQIATANGRTFAASVVLDSVSVGSITERRVRALVVRPGLLHENLLGMSFLERLASYEVRGNRLILRARNPRVPA